MNLNSPAVSMLGGDTPAHGGPNSVLGGQGPSSILTGHGPNSVMGPNSILGPGSVLNPQSIQPMQSQQMHSKLFVENSFQGFCLKRIKLAQN